MMELSKLFPDELFELYGQGDDREDFWKCYFKNGMVQYCNGYFAYENDDKILI